MIIIFILIQNKFDINIKIMMKYWKQYGSMSGKKKKKKLDDHWQCTISRRTS